MKKRKTTAQGEKQDGAEVAQPSPPQHLIPRELDEYIATTKEVLKRVPVDRSTLWRMCREGRFPKPIQLTRSRIGWRWSAVLAWLAEREQHPIESRDFYSNMRTRRPRKGKKRETTTASPAA